MTTGQKIKYLRKIKGLTQDDMADALNMSQQAYSRIENDQTQPSHEQMKKITETLGMSLENFDKWDGKLVFNNFGNPSNGQINHFKALSEDERGLYQQLLDQKDAEIAQLKEEIAYLKTVIDRVLKQ